jgi:D-serine deaminase-like pyridoxal phosphate-dependent protein
MATTETPLSLPELDQRTYHVDSVDRVLTPALLIYPEIVDSNIDFTLRLLDGKPERWRPHIKTSKLEYVMRRFVDRGVVNFKCSTSLELATVCGLGAKDVLIAYPLVGANARRVREIADKFTRTRISALVENRAQIEVWRGSRVGLFIDVNPGMDRTGIAEEGISEIVSLARAIGESGQEFRGLHYYDGHLGKFSQAEREAIAHAGYDHLIEIAGSVTGGAMAVDEVITAGTPAFPCTLSYSRFQKSEFVHRASPGTVVYADCTSLTQLPSDWGYRPAAVVISTVVSHPSRARITCDAGHKTVSADAGAPTCAVIGRPDLVPSKPSEEHLPMDLVGDGELPAVGETLYLVPRHVCPTINNFDHAVLVERGVLKGLERVTARGREAPLAV